jgi:hypothetical protein
MWVARSSQVYGLYLACGWLAVALPGVPSPNLPAQPVEQNRRARQAVDQPRPHHPRGQQRHQRPGGPAQDL